MEVRSYKIEMTSESLDNLIARVGYAYQNSYIRSFFFRQKYETGAKEFLVIKFEQRMTKKQTIATLQEMGLRPAYAEELVTFDLQPGDLTLGKKVLALGTRYQNRAEEFVMVDNRSHHSDFISGRHRNNGPGHNLEIYGDDGCVLNADLWIAAVRI